MCGINGIFAYHAAANVPKEAELVATRDAMSARGPDGMGSWWNDEHRCGFGHRRLAVLDLSQRASQPMISEDGNLVVTFNGEIYNYPLLRTELEADGVRFRTRTDTEVLLHLYAREGAEMVHRLRGMYAFAVWDEARSGIFLARDPYGIKPLYTANDGWTFRFASQVKALLSGGAVSRDPEPAGVVGFQLFGSVPEPFTLYRDIRALPAGHTQWIDGIGPREPKVFFKLPAALAEGMRHPLPAAELAKTLGGGVRDSVSAHLLADVEVGVFLSAGVDSGALLGLMREAGRKDVCAITLGFDEFSGTSEDEAPLAAKIAAQYGARHVVRRVGEREFRDDLPAILEAMDQPSIDGVNTWFVAKAAKEAGLKVALSGLGGDELLAGYPSFFDVPKWRRRFGPFARIPGLGRIARFAVRALAPRFAKDNPKAPGLLEYSGSWAGAYFLRRALFLPRELPDIMDPDVARDGMRRLKPVSLLRSHLAPDPGSNVGRVCALESSHYMRNQLLRDADWAGMAHSLEIRVPLVDATLLSAMAPHMEHLQPGRGKAALANAPSRPLPEEITNRAKTGFGVPTGVWMDALACGMEAIQSDAAKGLVSRRWSNVVFKKENLADASTMRSTV